MTVFITIIILENEQDKMIGRSRIIQILINYIYNIINVNRNNRKIQERQKCLQMWRIEMENERDSV